MNGHPAASSIGQSSTYPRRWIRCEQETPEAEAPEDVGVAAVILGGESEGKSHSDEDYESPQQCAYEEPWPAELTAAKEGVETDSGAPPERKAVEGVDDGTPGFEMHTGRYPRGWPR